MEKETGDTATWAASIIAGLLLVGAFTSVYSELNSRVLGNTVTVQRSVSDIKTLDVYDEYLEGELSNLKGDIIRTESSMRNLQRTTDKLEGTMGEILKEIKHMNENLIRLGVPRNKGEKHNE